MLEVSNVTAGYGGQPVLRGVNLTVGDREIVAVLGANGVGKTTLNKTISGLLRVLEGSVRFDGQDLTGASPQAVVDAGVIHVPEGRKIFPNMSVRDNLELGSYRRGRERRTRNLDRAFALFPRLSERSRQLAGTLSGGEQQMLAIGRGLMAEPRLLILDEPSLGLSPLLVEEMFGLITQVAADGLSVLLVEQNVVQSLEVAGHGHVMENGRIVLSGDSATLAADPALRNAYLGL